MNGRTKESLTYPKAALIEVERSNPIMNAIGSKKMNVNPKNWAIISNICVIYNLHCYKYLEPRE